MNIAIHQDVQLTKYDAMCNAIAVCHEIDEVAELHLQAKAMEAYYARGATNVEAERKAVEVRIRCERKMGEIFKGKARNQTSGLKNSSLGRDEPTTSEFKQSKTDANISDSQAKRWQKLADIPDDKFEESFNSGDVISTTGLIRDNSSMPRANKPMDSEAIKLWGCLRDFNNDISTNNLNHLLNELTDAMRDDVFSEAQTIITKCEDILHERL